MKLSPTDYLVVFITTTSFEEAELIAGALLEERKIACAGIVREVSSRFWWQGSINSAKESLIVAKTRSSELNAVIGIVKKLHSYQVPEVIALPIIYGNPDYLAWLNQELKGGGS